MRFLSLVLSTLLVAALQAIPAHAVEFEGVKFDDTIKLAGKDLLLNGTGLRTRFGFRVYAAGLYVPEKRNNAAELIAQKGPRRIELHMLRTVSAPDISESFLRALENNHTPAQIAALKERITRLEENLVSVGEMKKGDAVVFEYLPESGTQLLVNGARKGAAIPGEDFIAALLRIWLGDKPADKDLKKGWLGEM